MSDEAHTVQPVTPPRPPRKRWLVVAALAVTLISALLLLTLRGDDGRRTRSVGDRLLRVLGLLSATRGHPETAAISTLRNVSSSQAQFLAAGAVDEDADGAGEYGFFAELSGAAPLRGTPAQQPEAAGEAGSPPETVSGPVAAAEASGLPRGALARGRGLPRGVLSPPVLSGAFRTRDAQGNVRRSGYCFRLYLRAVDGTYLHDAPDRALPTETVDADAAEVEFLCYAWPSVGTAGQLRTFVVTADGGIYGTNSALYLGARAPEAPAFFPPSATRPPGPDAPPTVVGRDGNTWRRVH